MTHKIPTHEATYARLCAMLLFGRLIPGQAVTIQGLADEIDGGMTPVREAIRRLCADGALTHQGNRRISVARLDARQLNELRFARLAIEPRIVELAAPSLDTARVSRLSEIDRQLDADIAAGDVLGYLEANHRFHFTLYEAAGAEVLTAIARGLWLRFGPSLRVVCQSFRSGELPDRHRDALAAMERGDHAALVNAMRGDIAQGIERVGAAIEAGEI